MLLRGSKQAHAACSGLLAGFLLLSLSLAEENANLAADLVVETTVDAGGELPLPEVTLPLRLSSKDEQSPPTAAKDAAAPARLDEQLGSQQATDTTGQKSQRLEAEGLAGATEALPEPMQTEELLELVGEEYLLDTREKKRASFNRLSKRFTRSLVYLIVIAVVFEMMYWLYMKPLARDTLKAYRRMYPGRPPLGKHDLLPVLVLSNPYITVTFFFSVLAFIILTARLLRSGYAMNKMLIEEQFEAEIKLLEIEANQEMAEETKDGNSTRENSARSAAKNLEIEANPEMAEETKDGNSTRENSAKSAAKNPEIEANPEMAEETKDGNSTKENSAKSAAKNRK